METKERTEYHREYMDKILSNPESKEAFLAHKKELRLNPATTIK